MTNWETATQALLRGEAYVSTVTNQERERVYIDMPTGDPAVLLQDWRFGPTGNVRTQAHVFEHFYATLRGGVTHHASNQEWQRYSRDGISVDDHGLKLTASMIDPAAGLVDGNIQSGMVRSKWLGRYGYWEAKMKLSTGDSLWPAFWIITQDGPWPPEIDIMEQWNTPTEGLHKYHVGLIGEGRGTIVYAETDRWNTYRVVDDAEATPLADDYHTYAVEWTPWRCRFYFDDRPVHERLFKWETNEGRLAGGGNLIVNLAVGSSKGHPTVVEDFPASISIPRISVWDKRPTPARRLQMDAAAIG